jgi:two-component system, chemotaxis family, chemotaxis protein CheY
MGLSTILIVEDEALLRDNLEEVLREAGYPVRSAEDGQEAMGIMSSIQAPCLFIVDLLMPKMDGWEFLERIREHGENHGISHRVLVISGSASAEGIARQAEAGYLPKPFEVETFLTVVKRYFEAE